MVSLPLVAAISSLAALGGDDDADSGDVGGTGDGSGGEGTAVSTAAAAGVGVASASAATKPSSAARRRRGTRLQRRLGRGNGDSVTPRGEGGGSGAPPNPTRRVSRVVTTSTATSRLGHLSQCNALVASHMRTVPRFVDRTAVPSVKNLQVRFVCVCGCVCMLCAPFDHVHCHVPSRWCSWWETTPRLSMTRRFLAIVAPWPAPGVVLLGRRHRLVALAVHRRTRPHPASLTTTHTHLAATACVALSLLSMPRTAAAKPRDTGCAHHHDLRCRGMWRQFHLADTPTVLILRRRVVLRAEAEVVVALLVLVLLVLLLAVVVDPHGHRNPAPCASLRACRPPLPLQRRRLWMTRVPTAHLVMVVAPGSVEIAPGPPSPSCRLHHRR